MSLAGLGLVAGLAAVPNVTHAQSEAISLEEVIVTARKRSETALEIPESIATFNSTAIEQGAITDLEDVGNLVPNLYLSERGDGLPNVIIRGIGSFGNTQGVGFYLDDVQLYYDPSSRFGDLERIEVLKGPQGTLYGGNNIGGAVKFVSKRPNPTDFDAYVEAQAGEQNTRGAEAAVNIPLSDTWATRLFAFWGEDDGFLENPGGLTVTGLNPDTDRHVDSQSEEGGRLQLAGSITDKLSLFAWARYDRTDGGNNDFGLEFDQDYEYSTVRALSTDPRHLIETKAGTLQLDYDLGFATLTSLTAYADTEYVQNSDIDFSRDIAVFVYGTHDVETLTQELRLTSAGEGPLEWTVGAYYKQQENPIHLTLEVHPLMAATLGIIPVNVAVGLPETLVLATPPRQFSDIDREDLSGFVNGSYRTGNFELGAGLRVDNWQIDRKYIPTGQVGSQDEVEVLPKVSLSYFMNDDRSMLYANYGRGFEPGGFNETNFTGSSGLFGFDREKADSYELGYKGQLADNRVQLTLAGFLSFYTDRQFELATSDPGNPGGFVEGIINAGDSTQYGVEAAITWAATQSLSVSLGAGIVEAEWDDNTVVILGGAPVDISGNAPPWIPDVSGNLTINYERPAFADFDFWTRLQTSYTGEFSVDLPNTAQSDPYTLVNVGAGLRGERWEFAINVENLLDEEYFTDMTSFNAFNPLSCVAVGQPPGCPVLAVTRGQTRYAVASVRIKF